MLGGPLGAMLGAAVGHNFDKGLNNASTIGIGSGEVEKVQSAFFTATFSVMGHIAKSDGHVSKHEIGVAEDVMHQMRLNSQQRKVAIRLFEEGKKEDFPLQDILDQFRLECHRRRNLMQMFLEILIATALADGVFENKEREILKNTASILGFSTQQYNSILQRMQAFQHYHQAEEKGMSLNDAYHLLGINRNATDAEVKKAYRRQMNQHHPDKLVSKGLPQEMMDLANQKTQDIKTAYELIKSARIKKA